MELSNIKLKNIIGITAIVAMLLLCFIGLSATADTVSPVAPSVSSAFTEWKEINAQRKLKEDELKALQVKVQEKQAEIKAFVEQETPKKSYIESQGYKIDETTMSLKERTVLNEVASF